MFPRLKPFVPIVAALVAAVFCFYAVPLLSDDASIHWDAVDVHYSLQKYFSTQILHGKLPMWTPESYSGMPLLADPEVGAWYPLNWPFYLAGVTPRAIEWELALHAGLACVGAWLLALDLLGEAEPAILAGIFYGLSGFFAGHSSHVGIFQGAALFPWLLWSFRRAVAGAWWTYGPVAAAIGACILMAGHFQTTLYCFFGLGLFCAAMRKWKGVAVAAGVGVGTAVLSAVTWMPALALSAESIRAQLDFRARTNSVLAPEALLTLIFPNEYGAVAGPYHGPEDITQYYFYGGLLLPVLALAGLARRKAAVAALALLVPAVWYALGPAAGLYLLIARLPGFRSVRAPVHIWFVAALGLALLGAGGGQAVRERFRKKWVVGVLCFVAFADVYQANMANNPLAYARKSYAELYGNAAAQFAAATETVRAVPLHRFWAPADSDAFGPLNGALLIGLEATYGYNPLELADYAEYLRAAAGNPKLLNGLSVTHVLDARAGRIVANTGALPRATVPGRLVHGGELGELDPASSAMVPEGVGAVQDVGAKVEIAGYEGSFYRIRYTAATASVMRIAVPYFPGWRAVVDGAAIPVFVVDRALCGVVAPAGTHELLLRFALPNFTAALMTALVGWTVVLAGLCFSLLAGPGRSSLSAAPRPESPAR